MTNEDTREALEQLGVRADVDGLESLSPHERVALVPWAARGIIGNGGFKYFLEGKIELSEVTRAFREIGINDAASACEEVSTIIGKRSSSAESQAKKVAALTAADWIEVKAQEDAIYDVDWDDLLTAISGYIESHKDDISV